jgi:hypothetical protein
MDRSRTLRQDYNLQLAGGKTYAKLPLAKFQLKVFELPRLRACSSKRAAPTNGRDPITQCVERLLVDHSLSKIGKMKMNVFRIQIAPVVLFAFVTMGSSAALAACKTAPNKFDFSKNDTASISVTMDTKGCRHRFATEKGEKISAASIVAMPQNGTLKKAGNLAFRYQPKSGFSGSDQYTLKVCGSTPGGKGCSTLNYSATIQ